MARKTKQQARETRQLILDVALRLFSQQGVSSTSLATIAKAAGVTRGAIYWHFKNKSDLFNEIWELSDASISDLEIEYRAKFPNDPLSVIREILVYVLEATVTEERRRLMMEIIYHKCEFVGEMTVVQQAQRQLSRRVMSVSSRVHRGEAAARQFTHPAGGRVNAQLPFRADGKLAVCPRFVRPACGSAGLRRYSAGDVSILPDATRPGELVSLKVARGWA